MVDRKGTNFNRIAQAIDYIHENFKDQPSLDDIATAISMSPFHFQRLFTEWAGVSPKKFMQFLSINYAKQLLKNEHASLQDAAYETGLSGTSRLHDLFVNIEGMTPGEYKNGGEKLAINYCFAESPFGKIIVASTEKGVCHITFEDDEALALSGLMTRFPKAQYHQRDDETIRKNDSKWRVPNFPRRIKDEVHPARINGAIVAKVQDQRLHQKAN